LDGPPELQQGPVRSLEVGKERFSFVDVVHVLGFFMGNPLKNWGIFSGYFWYWLYVVPWFWGYQSGSYCITLPTI